MKINIVIVQFIILLVFIVMIMGKMIAISTSKIKNKIATRKNWIENGRRADFFGSNPHSKGDIFSRSNLLFFEIIMHNIINELEIVILIKIDKIILNITFSLFKIFWLEIKYIVYNKKVASSSVNWNI